MMARSVRALVASGVGRAGPVLRGPGTGASSQPLHRLLLKHLERVVDLAEAEALVKAQGRPVVPLHVEPHEASAAGAALARRLGDQGAADALAPAVFPDEEVDHEHAVGATPCRERVLVDEAAGEAGPILGDEDGDRRPLPERLPPQDGRRGARIDAREAREVAHHGGHTFAVIRRGVADAYAHRRGSMPMIARASRGVAISSDSSSRMRRIFATGSALDAARRPGPIQRLSSSPTRTWPPMMAAMVPSA